MKYHVSSVLTFELTILSFWFMWNRNSAFKSLTEKKNEREEAADIQESDLNEAQRISCLLNILLWEFSANGKENITNDTQH